MAYAPAAAIIATPIGPIRIEAEQERLIRVRIGAVGNAGLVEQPLLREAAAQLEAYFAGKLHSFDLPLLPSSTARGPSLRTAISAIRFGDTRSYGEIAALIGSSARAIGQACARNPFSIIVPCHRVVAAGGALGPYSAGDGATTKAWLLEHEGARARLL